MSAADRPPLVVAGLALSPLGKAWKAYQEPVHVVVEPTGRGTWSGWVSVCGGQQHVMVSRAVAETPELVCAELVCAELDRQVRVVAVALVEIVK